MTGSNLGDLTRDKKELVDRHPKLVAILTKEDIVEISKRLSNDLEKYSPGEEYLRSALFKYIKKLKGVDFYTI